MISRLIPIPFLWPYCFLALIAVHSSHSQVSDRSALIIQKQIEAEKQRGQRLQKEKQSLMNLMQNREKKLNNFDRQLRNYENNLQEAQKIIDAAEQETSQIHKRNNERELMVYRSIFALEPFNPPQLLANKTDQLHAETMREAIEMISIKIFNDIQEETPRLQELEQLIADRQAYQDRILTIYLPADTQKRSDQERLLQKNQEEVQEKEAISIEIVERVKDLQAQLAAAQKQIEDIRQQHLEELRKKEEQERKRQLAEAAKPHNSPASSQPAQQISADTSFEKLKGLLPWPARGSVARPFGEFTHPQFKVTMKNPGIDVLIDGDTPIRTIGDGTVLFAGEIPGLGRSIVVNHGQNYLSVYGNVTAKVAKGLHVKSQQIIGAVAGRGDSGTATYHFEIRQGELPLNPLQWLQQ
jgi:murein hydrolase activator